MTCIVTLVQVHTVNCMCLYYKMIAVIVTRPLKTYSLSDYQMHNTGLLTIAGMLYFTPPGFIYFIAGGL